MDMKRILALSDLNPNQEGRVISIRTKTAQDLHALMRAGVFLDVSISVVQYDRGHLLFLANCRELAVDQEIAGRIFVELAE
jgi:Fe2+ transport system protein FeoA